MSSLNARLIEKDIFEGVDFTQGGDSATITLDGASKFSCQAVYDVQGTAKTFDSGDVQVNTATFPAFAGATSGDYLVFYDAAGDAWAVGMDKTGSAPEPTGAAWAAVAADHKVFVDISGALSANDVATACATELDGLITTFQDSVTDADMETTMNDVGLCAAPSVHNANDSGAGSITVVVTTPGIDSEVNVDDDTLSIPSHGFQTGLKGQLTTTGTLPAGLSLLTNYWVIKIDDDTIQLASTLQNALDGVPVDITDQGAAGSVNTFTATALSGASLTFKKSNDGTNWVTIQTATTISADGSVMLEQPNVSYKYFKAVFAISAGQVDLQGLILVIGPAV